MNRTARIMISLVFSISAAPPGVAQSLDWQRTFSGSPGREVQQTRDGGYILLAETWEYGPGSQNILLIKSTTGRKKDSSRRIRTSRPLPLASENM